MLVALLPTRSIAAPPVEEQEGLLCPTTNAPVHSFVQAEGFQALLERNMEAEVVCCESNRVSLFLSKQL